MLYGDPSALMAAFFLPTPDYQLFDVQDSSQWVGVNHSLLSWTLNNNQPGVLTGVSFIYGTTVGYVWRLLVNGKVILTADHEVTPDIRELHPVNVRLRSGPKIIEVQCISGTATPTARISGYLHAGCPMRPVASLGL